MKPTRMLTLMLLLAFTALALAPVAGAKGGDGGKMDCVGDEEKRRSGQSSTNARPPKERTHCQQCPPSDAQQNPHANQQRCTPPARANTAQTSAGNA